MSCCLVTQCCFVPHGNIIFLACAYHLYGLRIFFSHFLCFVFSSLDLLSSLLIITLGFSNGRQILNFTSGYDLRDMTQKGKGNRIKEREREYRVSKTEKHLCVWEFFPEFVGLWTFWVLKASYGFRCDWIYGNWLRVYFRLI